MQDSVLKLGGTLMEDMTWWEIIGDRLGWYKFCQQCYRMRWFHRHTDIHHPESGKGAGE